MQRPLVRLLTLFFSLTALPANAALTYTPSSPMLEAGQSLILTLEGHADGSINWQPKLGSITDNDAYVTYYAPQQADIDTVTVTDSAGQTVDIGVLVLPKGGLNALFKPENATWDLYNHRGIIQAFANSKDGKVLWVGTDGGLEQRDANNGEVQRVYGTLDGLPANSISALLVNDDDGLWIGSGGGFARELLGNGLAYRAPDGKITLYTTNNSPLPANTIHDIVSDGKGGVWVACGNEFFAGGGLAHISQNRDWQVYTPANAPFPSAVLRAVVPDRAGGLWVASDRTQNGTGAGLVYRSPEGVWSLKTPPLDLSQDHIWDLAIDTQDRLWVGTENHGSLVLDAQAKWWQLPSTNEYIPRQSVYALLPDPAGGMWLGLISGFAYVSPDNEWLYFGATDLGLDVFSATQALSLPPAGGLWAGLSWSGASNIGLVRLGIDSTWQVYSQAEGMPYNLVQALATDYSGGMWIGTAIGGLTHRAANGAWQSLTPQNSSFPSYNVQAILPFNANQVWLGTYDQGVALKNDAGKWISINSSNSPLPDNDVNALEFTRDGVWMGTENGLAYMGFEIDFANNFLVYTTDNSALPSNQITALAREPDGSLLWVATSKGLALLNPANYTVYPVNFAYLSALRENTTIAISSLLRNNDGLWIGADGYGLGLLNDSGMQIMNTINSGLRNNNILSIGTDGSGGVWLGTTGGLVFRSIDGNWQHFNTGNSSLADNFVTRVYPDSNGGVWVGTLNSGASYLSFSAKTSLADTIRNAADRQALLTDKRAAIIVHPRGQSSGYNQELALDFMATYTYHSLHARGFDNSEILFLSYKPDLDFNADGQVDTGLVDGPVSLQAFRNGEQPRDLLLGDIEAALGWAKSQGSLSQPLVLVFVDHGIPGGLLLDPQGSQVLSGHHLDALLDNYQAATGNRVVVILEACHSGTLVDALQDPQRLVISSTDEGLAYYDDLGRNSFLKLYLDELRSGENFWQSLTTVSSRIAGYRRPLNNQRPKLAGDTLAKELCLNGCFGNLPGVLTLTVENSAGTVPVGEKLDLSVQTNSVGTSVDSLWASVITPQVAAQRTEQGYSRLPTPTVQMRKASDGRWRGRYDGFDTNGEYLFTFKARDSDGFITETKPLSLSVASNGKRMVQPRVDLTTLQLSVPAMTLPLNGSEQTYAMVMTLTDINALIWTVDMATFSPVTDLTNLGLANFNPTTGKIHLPAIEIPQADGTIMTLSMDLSLLSVEGGIRFKTDALY